MLLQYENFGKFLSNILVAIDCLVLPFFPSNRANGAVPRARYTSSSPKNGLLKKRHTPKYFRIKKFKLVKIPPINRKSLNGSYFRVSVSKKGISINPDLLFRCSSFTFIRVVCIRPDPVGFF